MVAISAGDFHALALKSNGRVVSWGDNTCNQTNVPADLTNAMAVAGGSRFSMALRNDGTVVAWGDNTLGQTNIPVGLSGVKTIAAGGGHALAAMFSPLVQYPLDVSKDLLLIYNSNSLDSSNVCSYYLQHRPMVSEANVLGIGCSNRPSFFPDEYNLFAAQVQRWLTNNPTKRPQYVILFLGIPWRVNTNALGFDQSDFAARPSVQWQLAKCCVRGWQPFVTAINMSDRPGTCNPAQPAATTNACVGYIKKLADMGTSNSPPKLIISASASGYANTNYYFDDSMNGGPGSNGEGNQARVGVLAANPTASIVYSNANDYGTNLSVDIRSGINVGGYLCHGIYSAINNEFPGNGHVIWGGNSGWYIMETVESFDGQPCAGQSDYWMWFSSNAFGRTDYSNTPVGALTYVDEPWGGRHDAYLYFGLWESGKAFGICAWNAVRTDKFQAVGDPFVAK